MQIAAVAFPESSDRLIKRPSVVSIKRRPRKVPASSNRSWARYKPASKWTVWVAFLLAIAIHIGAVAIVHPGRNEYLARLWENRISVLDNERPEERGD